MNDKKGISEETFKLCEIERQEVLEYFDQYWKHAAVLRNWFVVYGIGALALVITNPEVFSDISMKKWFVGTILLGVAMQVLKIERIGLSSLFISKDRKVKK